MEKPKERNAEFGAWLSIGVYVVLSILKLTVGYLAGSEALRADGLNNTSDIVASLAVLIGLRISKKPADADHRYGHSRAETIASMIASFIMIAVGLEVLSGSLSKLVHGEITKPDMTAVWVAFFSAGVMYLVYRYNIRLANRANSHALKAAAQDNLSDAMVSLGTVVGIFGAIWGLVWLDGVTAGIVGILIFKTGWGIFREASHMLTDGFDESELEKMKTTVQAMEGIETVKDIKGRGHGNQVFVDLTIEVDHEMSVYESHKITERVERLLVKKHKVTSAHVHIEPYMPETGR